MVFCRSKQVLRLAALLAMGCGVAAWGQSQQGKPTAAPDAPPHGETRPTGQHVPLLEHPLRLADFDGMRLRPELEGKVLRLGGFTQTTPNDGAPGTQKTEAYLGYTSTALYVVFLCFDSHPELIRGHMARRENILTDDYVGIMLDPFQDHRRGTFFVVNPMGVQADAAYTEGSGNDYSYDQVWDSTGRVTRQGWMALIAIPFRSLRFPRGDGAWGVVLRRSLPRNSENDYWPHISQNVAGTLTQEGTLLGIGGVTGSHNVQINPYALGQNEHTLDSRQPDNPYFSSRKAEATAGGEVKAILKDRVVFDATVNPDFSDVESDQPQFTVNQRYPVYFPELRPFFLENANYFSTPLTLLYTRNIVHPEFGGRITGKINGSNLGVLVADDREPGEVFAPDDPLHGKHALFGVGRFTQDIGKGSSLGAMYTDYEFAQSFNRVGGVDFTARFNDHWTGNGQAVVSSSKDLGDNYYAGPAEYLEIDRNGHSFNTNNSYQDLATNFYTQAGFIQTANVRSGNHHATYRFYPKKNKSSWGPLQSWGLEDGQNIAFDHQGRRVYHYSQFDPFFLLARNTTLAPIFGQNSDTVGPQDGYDMPASRNFTENWAGFVARSAPLPQLNFNIVVQRSGFVNYNPAPGQQPSLLNQQSVQALFSVLPFRSLTMDNTYLLDREHEAHTGADAYESQTFRTKVNYQFTQALSARMILEYDSVLVNPAVTSLQRTKQLSSQVLLTWLPHPGTAIYAGYNNDLQNLDRTLCQRGGNGRCIPGGPILARSNNYLNDGRQIFVKASYLFRF